MSDGENIKNMRRKKGLTQEELGRLLGVTKSSISRWESGERKVKLTTMRNIAGALNVPLECLVDGLDPSGHHTDPRGDSGQAEPVYGTTTTDTLSIGNDDPPKAADADDPDHIGAVSEIRGKFSERSRISLTIPQIDDPELLSAFEGFKELDKLTPSDIEDIKAILKLAQRIIEKRKRGE
jgi:transcriptional regulator with XRE-family HTH domain